MRSETVTRRMLGQLRRARGRLDAYPAATWAYRIVVGVVGLAVLALGVVMLPAPGPGWVVIFAGLGILATEFAFARKLLLHVRARYQAWVEWLGQQSLLVRAVISAGLLLLVAACAWAVGAFEVVAGWFGVRWPWLKSPFSLW